MTPDLHPPRIPAQSVCETLLMEVGNVFMYEALRKITSALTFEVVGMLVNEPVWLAVSRPLNRPVSEAMLEGVHREQ